MKSYIYSEKDIRITGEIRHVDGGFSHYGLKFLEAHAFYIFSLVFVLQPLAFFPKAYAKNKKRAQTMAASRLFFHHFSSFTF